MTAEPFLTAIDELFGNEPLAGRTAAATVRELTNPTTEWESPAAQNLQERHRALGAMATSFAESDDDLKSRLDAASQAVADGKSRMTQIKTQYQIDRARLAAASSSPEISARVDELDRTHIQDAIDNVRATQARLPTLATHRNAAEMLDDNLSAPPPAPPDT
jgi:thioesterase domain-containing protein